MIARAGLAAALLLTAVPEPAPDPDVNVRWDNESTNGTAQTEAEQAWTSEKAAEHAANEADSPGGTVGIGIIASPNPSLFEFDGPDGMCVVTDDAVPVAGLVPCDDRPTDDEPAEDGEEADDPVPVIILVSASDFAELPLVPAQVRVQPEGQSWTVVNLDTIAYTSGDPQVLSTQVLGFEVAVRATPVEFAWDFGDGSDPVVTTDPGLPYPDYTVAHAYSAVAEERRVSLTTTWVGEFQVAGQGPWIPIAGTAQTTSVSDPFEVLEVRTRLVPGPQADRN
ncbi:hypothetical protein IM660_11545 [Ruania alkalisoli]|uniref:PKD domain-containing protein n=1 Tax=Ruania alkalisoli TaxID=2779775 RepID=A0A7M1SPC8_9MICO|nr:hypothetical protein [Ruania alkalisoli]QOR69335.1 hypothetical protein IM660_11545 [Ruania alkalisoli]